MNEEIKNKLQRGLALTVKESWNLYKYIEALEQTELNPSYNSVKTELKPSDDCISREEAIRVAEQGQIQGYEWQFKKLCTLPSVTPKSKIGRWMATENEDMNIVGYYCSYCDLPMETEEKTTYCPNCGAKMEVEE